MNKFTAMKEHIAARRSIGVPISKLNALKGYFQMFFTVPKATIMASNKSIRNGHVRYDAERHLLIVE